MEISEINVLIKWMIDMGFVVSCIFHFFSDIQQILLYFGERDFVHSKHVHFHFICLHPDLRVLFILFLCGSMHAFNKIVHPLVNWFLLCVFILRYLYLCQYLLIYIYVWWVILLLTFVFLHSAQLWSSWKNINLINFW